MNASRRILMAVLALSTACGTGPTDPERPGPAGVEPLPPEGVYPFAWVGTYQGRGSGVVLDQSVTIEDARLSIQFDSDSVQLDRCPLCVTIELDTLFGLTNVDIDDPVRLSIVYVRGGQRRELLLERFSSGTTTGNVLSARLLMEPAQGGANTVDLSYLLERR